MNVEPPLVSVWVITYNHVNFIRQCLDGILAQQVSFTYEVCLGEDDSNDGTREICQEYADRYPNVIRLFMRDRNSPARKECVGPWQHNFIETFKACTGQYVAMCDGDDYWSDPDKLQKQIDLLEQHPDYSGCFHKIGRVDGDGKIISSDAGYPPRRMESYSLDFLLRYGNFSPMFSVVFRNHQDVAPEWIKRAPFGDMIVHTGNLMRGDYGFIDKVMGFYRIHQGGLASGSSRLHNVKVTIDVYEMLGKHFALQDRRSFRQGIRVLKISYFTEVILSKLIPKKIKQKLDQGIGRPLRALARRLLTPGQ